MEDLTQIPEVQSYFLEVDVYDQFEEVAKKHKLPPERVNELLDLSDAVLQGKLDFNQMPGLIASAFGIDEKIAQHVSADVAGYHLLPLENYIRGLRKKIIEWGGSIEDYPAKRIGGAESDQERFMKDFADRLDLNLPHHLMNRFVYLSQGYLSKKRAREVTAELMMRRLNIGGLELTAEQAEMALKMLDDERSRYEKEVHVEKEVVNEGVGKSMADVVNKKKAPKKVKVKDEEVENEKLKVEIQKVKRPVGKRVMPADIDLDLESEEVLQEEETPEIKTQPAVILTRDQMKKEFLALEREDSGTPNKKSANSMLAPVIRAFQSKHIPRRAFNVSVGAFMKGHEEENDLRATLSDYKFSAKEIEDMTQIVKDARQVALGKEKLLEESKKVDSKKLNNNLPVKSVSHALTKEVPVISGSILNKGEEEELKIHAKKAQQLNSKVEDKFSKKVEVSVNEALKPIITIFKKKRIPQKAFAEIARAHVRGIREPIRTKMLLQDKYKLEGADLESVMNALESARKLANQGSGQIQKSNPLEQQMKQKSVDLKKQEEEQLDKKHAEITKSAKSEKIELPKMSARVSAARTKAEELATQAEKIDEKKIKEAQKAAMPRPAKAKLSMPSVSSKEGERVTDVKFVRRLVGPVEEIGSMSVASFRRLSSDPKEAVMKIEDKLDLLQQTRYEDRIRGVKAWRQSPVNVLYMKMASESLHKGISVAEIASLRRNSGEETLSPAEISAIVLLNNRIKF